MGRPGTPLPCPPDAASTLVLWQGRRLQLFTLPPANLIASRLMKMLLPGERAGLRKGRQEGIQEDILEALTIRFEQVPDGLREAITAIHDPAHLRRLHRAAIQSATLEDFARSL